jgi:septum formation protein
MAMTDANATAAPQLILASASPRRARILESLGVSIVVIVPDVDETIVPGETLHQAVQRLARLKASAVAFETKLPVLAADTVVEIDEIPLGKPASRDEARDMLRRLSGRAHEVLTGICLKTERGIFTACDVTQVTFHALDAATIEWYLGTGEPFDKAGGYHIDGRGAFFVRSIQGSPSNVAGLPVARLLALAEEAGMPLGPPARSVPVFDTNCP